ncbi:MAG: carbon monoxide dehydrogenase, partial [Oscillospiraceae bacterium]
DLCEIGADCNFARIAMLRTDDIELHGEQASYEIIKSIEIKKYDVSPKGYMLRASALSNREQVRVSEGAVKSGITFEQIGNLFIKKYHENSHVQAVRIIFISLDDGPYGELEKLASTSVNISRALNHLISDLKMDCHSCEWKPVCDEVEGMKEIHQKMTEQTNGGIL